jgi:hypothetical protein
MERAYVEWVEGRERERERERYKKSKETIVDRMTQLQ